MVHIHRRIGFASVLAGLRLAVLALVAASILHAAPATAQAVEATTVYELTRTALDEIARNEPAIAIRLFTNLARLMAIRMRETNEILRGLEDSRG